MQTPPRTSKFQALHIEDDEDSSTASSSSEEGNGGGGGGRGGVRTTDMGAAGNDAAELSGTSHHGESCNVTWYILVFGQVLSFVLACAGAAQATLALNCHLSAPTFSILWFYAGLAALVLPVVYRINKARNDCRYTLLRMVPLQGPAWMYFGMAVCDVYANYFTVLAFKFTTITSVALFNALAIPSALILSKCWLRRQYNYLHLGGVLLCMLGILFNVLQDYEDDEKHDDAQLDEEYPFKMRGDLLAITGGLLFGVSNVLTEAAVQHMGSTYEYLATMGFFATLICIIQTLATEQAEVAAFFARNDGRAGSCSSTQSMGLLVVFALTNIAGYVGTARFLQISEATFLNLSLLTSDLWSVAFSVVAERIMPHPLFFVGLVFTISGVLVYDLAPVPAQEGAVILSIDNHQLVLSESGDDLVDGELGHHLGIELQRHDVKSGVFS